MGYWCTLHLFDDKKFYKQLVPALKGEDSDLANHCFEFLNSHIIRGINKLSLQEVNEIVNQTIRNVILISNSLDKGFKINSEYQKMETADSCMQFLENTEGYYDLCKFFEYMVFKQFKDNEIADGFMTLLEVAYYNQLGFIAGVDMR